MRSSRFWLGALSVIMMLSACVDGPTAPSSIRAGSAKPAKGGGITLEPVVVVGHPECDPYLDLDWCQREGGECMSSATDDAQILSSCPAPGTGIGKGGAPIGSPEGGSGDGEEPACDPQIHPDCEKPLTAADTATIRRALATMLRPPAQFTDSIARRDCENMANWLREALAAGAVFRGAFDSDRTNDPYGSHYGMYNPDAGHIHYDPNWLDAANAGNTDALREVAITGLHEAAHREGYQHPNGPTFDANGIDSYVDPPFHRLNPGPNSCVPR